MRSATANFPSCSAATARALRCRGADADAAREALAATAAWVRDDLDLALRIGMVRVADIRAQGFDVRVARYAPSENISIAMFGGGGIAWADAAMKRGEIAFAAGRARRAAGPERAVVPLRGNPLVTRRRALARRCARAGGRHGGVPRRGRGHRPDRREDAGRLAPGARPEAPPAPGRHRASSSRRAPRASPAKRFGCAGSRFWCGRSSRSS